MADQPTDRHHLRLLAELYGFALTVAGQNPHQPAFDSFLSPGERRQAWQLLDQVIEWQNRGHWPGEEEYAQMSRSLSRLQGDLYVRWQKQRRGDGSGRDV